MNSKGYGRKRIWPNMRYRAIDLEGKRKITKTILKRDIASSGRDLNSSLPNVKQGYYRSTGENKNNNNKK
jgi:hypothetical protein